MSNYKRYFNILSNPVFVTFVTYNRREILLQNIDIDWCNIEDKYKINNLDYE